VAQVAEPEDAALHIELEKMKRLVKDLSPEEDITLEKLQAIVKHIDEKTLKNCRAELERMEEELEKMEFKGPNTRRSEMEIVAHILNIARKRVNQTEILYQANLSGRQLRNYLLFLTSSGFLKGEKRSKGIYYTTTSKGRLFLYHWLKILRLLEKG